MSSSVFEKTLSAPTNTDIFLLQKGGNSKQTHIMLVLANTNVGLIVVKKQSVFH